VIVIARVQCPTSTSHLPPSLTAKTHFLFSAFPLWQHPRGISLPYTRFLSPPYVSNGFRPLVKLHLAQLLIRRVIALQEFFCGRFSGLTVHHIFSNRLLCCISAAIHFLGHEILRNVTPSTHIFFTLSYQITPHDIGPLGRKR